MNLLSHTRTKPKFALYMLAAVIVAACLMIALEAPGAAQAQSGDYDPDNDGLININYLEQLDAVHYDLNGDGAADPDGDAAAYAAAASAYASAFPGAIAGMGCPDSRCTGYELDRSLDFDDPASYMSNAVRTDWTSGGGWFPIGVRDFDHSFATTFDGNNNTIANLFIDDANHEPEFIAEIAALFGRNEGTIRRIGVTDADITGHYDVGILAGYNHGIIEDSYSTGASVGEHNVGGLVGENDEDAVITRSWSSAVVRGPTDVGGLVGSNGGDITHSHATGIVSGENEIGGLVGETHRGIISNCYATGQVWGFEQVGGLVGRNDRSTITLSYATGDVVGSGGYMGGLVGYMQGGFVHGRRQTAEISFSYATGTVQSAGLIQFVGGLVGRAQSSHIIASYSTSDIPESLAYAGGLVGANIRNDIIASYSTGNIEGFNIVGGMVGLNVISSIDSSYSIGRVTATPSDNSHPAVGGIGGNDATETPAGVLASANYYSTYWDTERSAQDHGLGSPEVTIPRQTLPEGKTTAELQAPTGYTGIYAGWRADLDNADGDNDPETGIDDFWDFGSSDEYPALKADFNGDGIATWQEFGDQNRTPDPLPGPTPIPTPEPTPITKEQVIAGLDAAMEALQAFQDLLSMYLTGSGSGNGEQPMPTPSATPEASPSPVASATPASGADACVETLEVSNTIYPTWSSDCATDRLPIGATPGTRYARLYTFTLPQASTATITLTSEAVPDTYLYLLDGVGRDGVALHENDDIDTAGQNYGSRISESLPAGSYTIVATTYNAEQEGEFTLSVQISVDASTQ